MRWIFALFFFNFIKWGHAGAFKVEKQILFISVVGSFKHVFTMGKKPHLQANLNRCVR